LRIGPPLSLFTHTSFGLVGRSATRAATALISRPRDARGPRRPGSTCSELHIAIPHTSTICQVFDLARRITGVAICRRIRSLSNEGRESRWMVLANSPNALDDVPRHRAAANPSSSRRYASSLARARTARFSIRLEACDAARVCFRADRIAAGTDLFGDWLVDDLWPDRQPGQAHPPPGIGPRREIPGGPAATAPCDPGRPGPS
jgi:hypothetical protein